MEALMGDETLYPHIDGSGRGMDDGDCIHCGVSGSLEGAECPVRLRKLIRRMERWQPYDEHGQPVTQAAYNVLVSRLATDGERMDTITRLTRERDDLQPLADTYIDLVKRTARALGIPEVDEDGAMPSLHDVPERVAGVVREREVLLGRFGMLGYMLGMGPDDDTSPEAVLRFAERLNRGNEPTDDDATQDPPQGWGGGEVSDGE